MRGGEPKGRKVTPAQRRGRGGERALWISLDPGNKKRGQCPRCPPRVPAASLLTIRNSPEDS